MDWQTVLTVIATFVVTEGGKEAVKDTYKYLKSKLVKEFGESSAIADAIEDLEKDPDSRSKTKKLGEELKSNSSKLDPEIIGIAQTLLDQLEPDRNKQATMILEAGRDIKDVIVNSPGAKIEHIKKSNSPQ